MARTFHTLIAFSLCLLNLSGHHLLIILMFCTIFSLPSHSSLYIHSLSSLPFALLDCNINTHIHRHNFTHIFHFYISHSSRTPITLRFDSKSLLLSVVVLAPSFHRSCIHIMLFWLVFPVAHTPAFTNHPIHSVYYLSLLLHFECHIPRCWIPRHCVILNLLAATTEVNVGV